MNLKMAFAALAISLTIAAPVRAGNDPHPHGTNCIPEPATLSLALLGLLPLARRRKN